MQRTDFKICASMGLVLRSRSFYFLSCSHFASTMSKNITFSFTTIFIFCGSKSTGESNFRATYLWFVIVMFAIDTASSVWETVVVAGAEPVLETVVVFCAVPVEVIVILASVSASVPETVVVADTALVLGTVVVFCAVPVEVIVIFASVSASVPETVVAADTALVLGTVVVFCTVLVPVAVTFTQISLALTVSVLETSDTSSTFTFFSASNLNTTESGK